MSAPSRSLRARLPSPRDILAAVDQQVEGIIGEVGRPPLLQTSIAAARNRPCPYRPAPPLRRRPGSPAGRFGRGLDQRETCRSSPCRSRPGGRRAARRSRAAAGSRHTYIHGSTRPVGTASTKSPAAGSGTPAARRPAFFFLRPPFLPPRLLFHTSVPRRSRPSSARW